MHIPKNPSQEVAGESSGSTVHTSQDNQGMNASLATEQNNNVSKSSSSLMRVSAERQRSLSKIERSQDVQEAQNALRPITAKEKSVYRSPSNTDIGSPQKNRPSNKNKTGRPPLPVDLFWKVGEKLPDRDLANFSKADKTMNYALGVPLNERKVLFKDAIARTNNLTRLPRESRFEEHQKILGRTHPRVPVLNNLIDVHWHLPRAHRAEALKCLNEQAEKLPFDGREVILARLEQLRSPPEGLAGFDDLHDRLAEIAAIPQSEERANLLLQEFSSDRELDNFMEEQWVDVFDATLKMTDDPRILEGMANIVSATPQFERARLFDIILNKTDDPIVLKVLAKNVGEVQESQRTWVFDNILNKTDDPLVLEQLVMEVKEVKESERGRVFDSIINKSEDPRVLAALAFKVRMEGVSIFEGATRLDTVINFNSNLPPLNLDE